MKILVVGSRGFDDYELLKSILNDIIKDKTDIEIVSGGANGADKLAEAYAKEYGYKCTVIRPDWQGYGKSAGYIRNNKMHEYISHSPDRLCITFWDGISRGTQHSFALAEKYDNPIQIIKYKELQRENNCIER